MIKKVILTIFSLLCLVIPTFADDSTMTLSNFTSVQTVSPDICSKIIPDFN
jgi:hypothetical protein